MSQRAHTNYGIAALATRGKHPGLSHPLPVRPLDRFPFLPQVQPDHDLVRPGFDPPLIDPSITPQRKHPRQ